MLTERFSEDALEEYFENQRKIGRRPGNLMPRNSVTMTIPLEFKETFPTLRVIHGDDSTEKDRGIMLQMIQFQKNNRRK